ncbi:ATP-binding protein [Paludifilum halophilum]|uniref:histidine kinase n=1 Tax=Paludifilum halophilum TaxID=1642702 RepID=A0A235B6N9_9BACL|nr:ATP-binding protein [Paludifilum halophilum]OYD07956.1 hypothetical protein CHM34_07480 [Paludifilum halophilum]
MTEWLITLVEGLNRFFSDPAARWTGIILCASALLVLLFGSRFADKVPFYLYPVFVLLLLTALDVLTGDWSILWVYLVSLGLLNKHLTRERAILSTLVFFGVYMWVQSGGSVWEPWGQPQNLVNDAILFVFFGCLGGFLRRTRKRTEEIQGENRRLVEKVDEAQNRMHEYIDELEETSRRDYLTSLYNFSGFQEQVARSLSRCCIEGHYYHVICVDLVDFQQVNMREGIDAGDQLLVQIARQLKRKLPPYAQVARYDGDQFAVGLTGDDSAMRLCLETVEKVIGGLRAERSLVNYCIGSASYPGDAHNATELIRLAESRLSIEQRRIRHREEERRRHLEKLSAVGQLAAGLAHEIRNPLTSIRGFIQISASESPEVKKWESIILPEIDRINDLLKQFLHLSESRPARHTLFNLDRLIDDVLQLLHPKAILMGHELTPKPPSSPVIIEADAEQLKQVLINLVQNGLESLNDKGVVCVRWKELRDRISIRIQDTGAGIQPEHMSRIFDPFFTTKGDGTGMGLSICHRIISEHGGQIHVTSQPGRGTTFNIHLPVRQLTHKDTSEEDLDSERREVGLAREEAAERVSLLKTLQ